MDARSDGTLEGRLNLFKVLTGPCGKEVGEGGLDSLGEDDEFSGCGVVGYEGAMFGN